MDTYNQQLLWTVTHDPDEQCTAVKIARTDDCVIIKKVAYTPEQVNAFAQKN